MFKRVVSAALICLTVVPLNTYAASQADIDNLVIASQSQAQETVLQKIKANQELVAQITNLEAQIQEIKASAADNRYEMKKDLVIAGGTALATTIAVLYFGRATKSELGSQISATLQTGALVLGSVLTVKSLGSGGYDYLLLKVDENKLPDLESKLATLKTELEKQTAELLK